MSKRLLFLFSFVFISLNYSFPQDLSKTVSKKPFSRPFDTEKVLIQADPFIQAIVDQIRQSNLTSEIQKLQSFKSRNIQSDSLNSAKKYLISRITTFGYTPELHNFTYSGRNLSNIVVTIPGKKYPNKIIVVGGHYDSISPDVNNAPGADDNGSGTAVILEALRIFKNYNFDYTVKFILFSAEEQGLIGSKQWVQSVAVPNNLNIVLMINLDMIGGDIAFQNTKIICERDEDNNPSSNNAASAAFTDTLASFFPVYSTISSQISNAYGSDYLSFEDAGYVITGLFEQNETRHYHKTTDLLEYVDINYLFQVSKGAIAAISHFSKVVKKYCNVDYKPSTAAQDSALPFTLKIKVTSSSPVVEGKVFFKVNSGPYSHMDLTLNGTTADTSFFSGTIPPQNYGTQVRYYLYFRNSENISTYHPADTSTAYEYLVQKDALAPTLTGTVLSSCTAYDFPMIISAQASDASGIKKVLFNYSINGGPVTSLPMNHYTLDQYKASVPQVFSAGDSVAYYYTAIDNSPSNNIKRFPESEFYSFNILNSTLYDFETDDGQFTASNDWAWGTPPSPVTPFSGQKVWGTMKFLHYSNNITSDLVFNVDLNEVREAFLSFNHFFNTEPTSDGGNIMISMDGGSNYSLVIPQNGYNNPSVTSLGAPGYSGNSYFWKNDRINLQPYLGKKIKIKFRFASDFIVYLKGWFIDNVRIDYRTSASTPVELLSFETMPSSEGVIISWETASQLNVDKFIVEKEELSTGRKEIISIVKGQGTSTVKQDYQIIDKKRSIAPVIYRLYEVVLDGRKNLLAEKSITDNSIPQKFSLEQNFPNPFNPSTDIRFSVSEKSHVRISVYNINGELVAIPVNEVKEPAVYETRLNLNNSVTLPSGVYFYTMEAVSNGNSVYRSTRKMLLLK